MKAPADTRPIGARYPEGSFLAALTDEERADVLRLARAVPFVNGQPLLRQGDTGEYLLIVLRGTVKIVVGTPDGREVLLGLRGRGEPLGEVRYLRGGPHTATVLSVGDGTVLRLGFAALEALLRRHPRMLARLARCVVDRLDWADRRRTELPLPVLVRVCQLLHELAAGHAATGPDGVTVPLTQRELGQLVGAAEVTVQRALRELCRRGCLTPGYGGITVTRPARLARLVAEAQATHGTGTRTTCRAAGAPPR